MSITDTDAATTIDTLKNTVIASLTSADSDVRIRKTDYFNHTFAPDLVLDWSDERESRRVYLRTTLNPGYLLQDLELLDERGSIVMPLAELDGDNSTAGTDDTFGLQAQSHSQRALVASPNTFMTLGRQRSEFPVVGLASRALLQGGSGFVNLEQAADFGTTISTGFSAAQSGDSDKTAAALSIASDLLDPVRSDAVSDFLHAVWVGSGQDGTTFPGESGLSPRLSPSALTLLLNTVEIDDDSFWRRVGKNMTMALLEGLEFSTEHENFQRLIQSNAAMLKVRSSRMIDAPRGEKKTARWFATKGELGLRMPKATVIFGGGRLSDLSVAGLTSEVGVSELARRAARAAVTVAEVTVDNDELHVEYSTLDGTSILDESRVSSIRSTLGEESAVSRATIEIGGSRIKADFRTSTAHGNTGSSFYLSQIALSSVPLFVKLSRDDLQLLKVTVGAVGTADDLSAELTQEG